MKILYYDCFAGISGDMNLAAMIDLGVEPDYVRQELGKLGLDEEFELVVQQDGRNGIQGTRVDVQLEMHSHDHDDHHHHAPHRNFADIRKIIIESSLSEDIKETSLAIFKIIAEAEGKVHGKPMDEVHFHEVGATDSIVDIVGAAICYHRLDIEAVWTSSIELGGGFVRCAHGTIPVPAPATVEILEGVPSKRGGTDIEATTPTGAAILATLTDKFTDSPAMTVSRTGYGVGHKQTVLPNLLRVNLAEVASSGYQVSSARLLQCNIDDMTGEMLGDTLEFLMEQGAMDVHFTSIIMKKNRPAIMVSLLCSIEDEPRFTELLFRHTTTLGVKSFPMNKSILERRYDSVETPLGKITIKRALLDGEVLRSKPEFEECKELARKNDIPLTQVYAKIREQE